MKEGGTVLLWTWHVISSIMGTSAFKRSRSTYIKLPKVILTICNECRWVVWCEKALKCVILTP